MRIPSAVTLVALGAVLTAGAFQLGHAQATGERTQRRRTPVAAAVAHAAPAVVSVDAIRTGRRSQVRSSGAGVIVHPDGYVVTNSHVVNGAQTYSVELFGGQGSLPATLVADDPSGDLAILKIQRPGGFRHVSLCATGDLMLGETAIAIGNPHGLGDTITVGVVSALGRQAKMANGVALRQLIQTDASINTGNSGGALLNLDGELIGINVSLLPSATGIAFAISADAVGELLRRATGRAPPANAMAPGAACPDRPQAQPEVVPPVATRVPTPTRPPPQSGQPGASSGGQRPPPTVREPAPRAPPASTPTPSPRISTPLLPEDLGFRLEDNGARVVVSRVDRSSAAAIAGLAQSDLLLSIDGRPIESATDLLFAFAASRPGREYYLTVRRSGQVFDLVLVAPR